MYNRIFRSETICICDIYDQIYGCILFLLKCTLFLLLLNKADAILIKISVGKNLYFSSCASFNSTGVVMLTYLLHVKYSLGPRLWPDLFCQSGVRNIWKFWGASKLRPFEGEFFNYISAKIGGGGRHCVEIGFYADISWESRCINQMKFWAHFNQILGVFL